MLNRNPWTCSPHLLTLFVAIIGIASTVPANADELGRGKATFDSTCTVCHTPGIAGAPKLGDKAAWGARTSQGTATLYDHAIKGFQGKTGMMPPKGGNPGIKDDDVKSAVDYMVNQAK